MDSPKLPLTVPMQVWVPFATETSPAFADSYLSGADLLGTRLTPKTVTAWMRLRESFGAKKALAGLGLTLAKPAPFHQQQQRRGAA